MLAQPIRYDASRAQAQFHNILDKFFAILSMGYGGGKTYALCMKLIQLATINRGLPGGVLCPSLKMFKRDVYPELLSISHENDLDITYNAHDNYLSLPITGSKVYVFHDEDKGASIKGVNLAFGVINEMNLISEQGFHSFLARIRLKKAVLKQLAMSGTPEEFNWFYDMFVAEANPMAKIIFGDARDNSYVASEYFDILKNSYDDLMQQRYIGGQYVSLLGKRALYAFDRLKHGNQVIERDYNAPVKVSCDFNVYPMTATLWNYYPKTSQYWYTAFGEIKIDGADTFDLCNAIRDAVGADYKNAVIYPDPAGNARSTKDKNVTDISIMRQFGFKNLRFKSKIKSVRSELNAANSLFYRNRVLVSKNCKHTIRDYERSVIAKNSFTIDKSNPELSHYVDGTKNMLGYDNPIIKPHRDRVVRIR